MSSPQRSRRTGHRGAPARSGRIRRAARAPFGSTPDDRPLHFFRSDGSRADAARPGHRRPPAPAHRAGDGDLPFRRRDGPPRQPRVAAGDPAGRRQLDAGRPRDRPLRADRRRGAPARRPPARHPVLGRAADGQRGGRPPLRSSPGGHDPRARPVRARRCGSSPGRLTARARPSPSARRRSTWRRRWRRARRCRYRTSIRSAPSTSSRGRSRRVRDGSPRARWPSFTPAPPRCARSSPPASS